MYCRNDQARSSSWDFSYSQDGNSFVERAGAATSISHCRQFDLIRGQLLHYDTARQRANEANLTSLVECRLRRQRLA